MNLKEQLQEAIAYCNTKLASKGVTEPATSVVDIGDKIESIQGGDTGVGSRQWWEDALASKKNLDYLFQEANIETTPIIDCTNKTSIKYMCENCPNLTSVNLTNTQNIVYYNYAFSNNPKLVEAPEISTSSCQQFNGCYYNCENLKTIPLIDGSNINSFSVAFSKCPNLVDIRFVKGSIHVSIAFYQSSMLSAESVQSIIDGLADLTGQASQTLSLNALVKEKLTDEQIAQITSKNWTLA